MRSPWRGEDAGSFQRWAVRSGLLLELGVGAVAVLAVLGRGLVVEHLLALEVPE